MMAKTAPQLQIADRSIAPVMFGVAGVIYTNVRAGQSRDESWLERAFQSTPHAARIQWRSDDVTIVTCQHAHEAGIRPGSREVALPAAGELQGLIFGAFFDVAGSEVESGDYSRKILAACASDTTRDHGCFRQINGAWGAVVWDRRQKQARFARDLSGAQVLYVAQLADRIVFATDLRIFQRSGMLTEVDEQAVAEFLHFLYVAPPRTLAKGCHALLPGHVLTVGPPMGQMRQDRYSPDRFVDGPSLSRPEDVERAVEEHLPGFEKRLLDAVEACIPATGRIVLTLSGGKDSSALAVAVSKICPDRVLALTVGQRDRTNEANDAALVCRALNLPHQCYVPSDEDLVQGLQDFARVQDQAIGDPASLPYFLAMSRLPDDCTLILDGSGNDPYFGMPSRIKGVGHYLRRTQWQKYLPGPLWPLFLRSMSLGPSGLKRLARLWSRPVEESFVPWDAWSDAELTQLFGRKISFDDTYMWQLMRKADPHRWVAVHTEQFAELWEPNTTTRKAIDFAHAAGRGLRLPFMDNRIAAFVNELPQQLKYQSVVNKMILRAYMRKNLPREIVDKPKQGFIFDLNRLFRNPQFRWAEELQRAGLLRFVPSWSEAPIRTLLDRYEQAPNEPRWQQRLYVLCLMATVLAAKNGYTFASRGHT